MIPFFNLQVINSILKISKFNLVEKIMCAIRHVDLGYRLDKKSYA
jgi:hypothetical protein